MKNKIDRFGMDTKFIDTIRPIFQFLYYTYFRVESRNVENVPNKGPVILVANHSGTLPYDGIMINLAVYNEHSSGRYARFLVENFVFRLPLIGEFIERTGGVPACHENATELIKKNELLVVFPEGVRGISKTYDERYTLQRFGHGGFVRLAMRTGAPIVPVSVIGAEEIHPLIWKSKLLAQVLQVPFIPFTPTFPWLGPLGLVPLPSKWKIVFGKPISFDKFNPKDAENETFVEKYTAKIRNEIQKTVNRELAKRKSIWI